MKKTVLVSCAVAAMTLSSAHAALLDFANEADSNFERAVANGTVINFGGTNVTFSATNGLAYFDAGDAGLGVCATGVDGAECSVPSDDNITVGESATITFDFALDLLGLSFRDVNHNDLSASLSTLLINGVEFTFAAAVSAVIANVAAVTFTYGGSNPEQFYVNAATTREITSQIPIPAALPLLISGLAGLGFASRRRKQIA